jgi:hypothetical protein
MLTTLWKTKCALVMAALLGIVTLASAQTNAPKIISTSPASGATKVKPGVDEITVTFDRDMDKGMSWTGNGPDYPLHPSLGKPSWRDKRTCVMPVILEPAHFYRVGINSKSYQNFRSAEGVPAEPSAIYFTTHGADKRTTEKLNAPKVLSFEPANGATNVSASLHELEVKFNVTMGGGFSLCTYGDDDHDFPKPHEGQGCHWAHSRRTCVIPVDLKPGMTYRLKLNAPGYNNFQSAVGIPLEPVTYIFTTSPN